MGFGGSALAAIQVMRNNRAMLGKREKGKLSYVAKSKPFVDTKKASPELLKQIRERIIRERKKRRYIRILATILILIIAIVVWFVIDWNLIFTSPGEIIN